MRCRLKTPYFGFMQACAASVNSIVQNGTTKFSATKLIGTGHWKVKRIVPSRRSDYVRNPNYFVSGRPYLDELTTIILSDSSARFNALLAGQVDVIESIDATQVQTLSGKSNFKVLQTVTGHWVPMCMDITQAPFNDVRVRQALRLVAEPTTDGLVPRLSGLSARSATTSSASRRALREVPPAAAAGPRTGKFAPPERGPEQPERAAPTSADAGTGMLRPR